MLDYLPISIRPLTEDDADAVIAFESANRAYFERFVPPRSDHFFDRNWQRENLRNFCADKDMRMCLILSPTSGIIGRINLSFVKDDEGQWADIGYRVGEAFGGRNVATRALRSELSWLRNDGRFRGAIALARLENPASVRVLEKAGFRHESNSVRVVSSGSSDVTLHRFRLSFSPD